MWTYTAYLIKSYLRSRPANADGFPFGDLCAIAFVTMLDIRRITFWKTSRELFQDILQLHRMGLVELDGTLALLYDRLEEIQPDDLWEAKIKVPDVRMIDMAFMLHHEDLYDDWVEVIDRSVDEFSKSPPSEASGAAGAAP